MTAIVESVSRLVRALDIKPASCRHTALVLAGAQDDEHGVFAATMADIAAWTGLSKCQVRKHVHSLISLGVLRVVANAHGGSPLHAPQYQFVASRLRDFAHQMGATPDLFDAAQKPRMSFLAEDESGERHNMAIELHGQPGRRTVRFFLQGAQGDVTYGWAPLQVLLQPCLSAGSWTGWLNPESCAPDGCLSVRAFPETVEKLQRWAQAAALGRTESVVEA